MFILLDGHIRRIRHISIVRDIGIRPLTSVNYDTQSHLLIERHDFDIFISLPGTSTCKAIARHDLRTDPG